MTCSGVPHHLVTTVHCKSPIVFTHSAHTFTSYSSWTTLILSVRFMLISNLGKTTDKKNSSELQNVPGLWCNITEHERETQPTILFYLEVVVDFLSTNPHYNGIGSYRGFRVQGVRKLQNVATGCSVDPLSNPVVINVLLVHRKGHVQQDTTLWRVHNSIQDKESVLSATFIYWRGPRLHTTLIGSI